MQHEDFPTVWKVLALFVYSSNSDSCPVFSGQAAI